MPKNGKLGIKIMTQFMRIYFYEIICLYVTFPRVYLGSFTPSDTDWSGQHGNSRAFKYEMKVLCLIHKFTHKGEKFSIDRYIPMNSLFALIYAYVEGFSIHMENVTLNWIKSNWLQWMLQYNYANWCPWA